MSSRNRLCHGLRSKSAYHLLEPRLSRIRAAFEGEQRPHGEAQRAWMMTLAQYALAVFGGFCKALERLEKF